MKTKIGLPFGLALVVFIGVFTTMLALGVLTPDRADAEVEEDSVELELSHSTRGSTPDVTITFSNDDTDGGMTLSGGVLDITLSSGFEAASDLDSTTELSEVQRAGNWDVTFDPPLTTGDPAVEQVIVVETVSYSGQALMVTLQSRSAADTAADPTDVAAIPADTAVEIKFTADKTQYPPRGLKIIDTITPGTPEMLAVTIGDDPAADPTSDDMAIVDGPGNFMVDNTVKRPGAVSGYRIRFTTLGDLVANQDVITVHFDKDFKGHGTSLSKSHVTVSSSAPDQDSPASADNTAITGTEFVLQTGAFNPGSDASLDRLTSEKHHLPNKDALNNIEYQIIVPDMNGTSEGAPGIRGTPW